MKKTYQKPVMDIVTVTVTSHLLDASPSGVETGGKTNDEYSVDDVTYSRRGFSIWDDEE